ncbi:hypothetical protein LTR08_008298 [Meristemomyces frigidus]|nr:hypothetical protein LTR08_008298 [Meristemomyces frigidus]
MLLDLQHQVTLKSLAHETLQSEYSTLLQKFQRDHVKNQAIEKKTYLADNELNELTGKNEDLTEQVKILEVQIDDIERKREAERAESAREKEQWGRMLEMGGRLHARNAEDRQSLLDEKDSLLKRVAACEEENVVCLANLQKTLTMSTGPQHPSARDLDSGPARGWIVKAGPEPANSSDVASLEQTNSSLRANIELLRKHVHEVKRHNQDMTAMFKNVSQHNSAISQALDRALNDEGQIVTSTELPDDEQARKSPAGIPQPAASLCETSEAVHNAAKSTAKEFKSMNLRVFATARKATSISDLEDQGIETLSLEVTKSDSIDALKNEISSRTGGKLDYLVNNAGRNYTVPALDVDLDEVRDTFETNLFAVMRMCQAFAPLLIEAKGTVVQIGSLAGVMPYAFGSVYNASKAALHSYSDTLRLELAPFDVRVVTIVTGGVKSNIARTHRTLVEGSRYQPLAKEYEERQTHSQANAISNEDYARSVVAQVLGSPSKTHIWEGGKSWLVWFVVTFLPRRVMDITMTRMFKLWKLRESNNSKLD